MNASSLSETLVFYLVLFFTWNFPLIRLADLHHPQDSRWVVDLLDMYCRDEFGDSAPLSEKARDNLIPGLIEHGGARVYLAFDDATGGDPIGVAICLLGFSS